MSRRHRAAPMQTVLLGDPEPIPGTRKPTVATQDPELVASVVRAAISRGYVLIGPAQRVYLREAGRIRKGAPVEPVPPYEQATVQQLLDAGLLTTGGTHIVRCGNREGPATSVLVPRDTRAMVTRWGNYVPLHGRRPAPHGGQGDGDAIATQAKVLPPNEPGRERWVRAGRDPEIWDRHAIGDHRLCSAVQGAMVRLDANGSPDGCRRAGRDLRNARWK